MSPLADPSSKIQPRHLDRLAIVYVRQSTLQQLERHHESTALQYGLAERACGLGWPAPRVQVIDADLGCSGASAAGRPGFQQLVAEVGLGHVGLVLGIEVSRLARSCRDWYHLLEICALAGTLIADGDGIYDPAHYNDRLLLGLKGTMSEAELHIMRARLSSGRRHKAERGELGFHVPRGYVRRPSGEVILDPDERVRDTISLIFDLFARRRSVHGVLRYLAAHRVDLPDRLRDGPAKGELVWRQPHHGALLGILTNPAYAGAYAFGRRIGPWRRGVGVKPRRCPQDWPVLLHDRLPRYISWETYEENQRQLTANQARNQGTARSGPSLLAGLIVCGRCGYRMTTSYRTNGHDLSYACVHALQSRGEAACQSLSGAALDALVAGLILAVLAPSALAVSLAVAEDLELERAQRRRQWTLELEQAAYEVERARRQYDAVEPENRLVARTLEKRWEAALAAHAQLADEHARLMAHEAPRLTPAEQAAIRRLAEDVPALWHAETTTAAERKEIARLLLERVVVTVEGRSENVAVECVWAGGQRSRHRLLRSVARITQLSRYPELMARIEALHQEGHRAPAIARCLNDEGWRAPHGGGFTGAGIWSLLAHSGRVPKRPRRPSGIADRAEGEYTLIELARRLDVPRATIYAWLYKGWLKARKTVAASREIWLVQLDDVLELQTRRNVGRQRQHPPDPADAAEQSGMAPTSCEEAS